MECRDKKALKGQPFEDWILERRWWESNPRALADLSHFECDLLRPLEYISRKPKLIILYFF